MTVKELIEKLEGIENKNLPVRVCCEFGSEHCVGGESNWFSINHDSVTIGGEKDSEDQ